MGGRIFLSIKRFLVRTDGPTSVEYAVLLAVIVGTALISITYFGKEAKAMSDLIVITLSGKLSSGE
jgi:Flp pilus assembly pilin Flp